MTDIMEKPWYPVVYMFFVTAVFSGILVGLSAATRERVARNEQIFRERAVVVALGLAADTSAAAEVHKLYTERVAAVKIDPDGPDTDENISEYELKAPAGGPPVAYGIPIYGQGYWDEIRGVLGVKADRKSIIGVAFYQQKETPGLGAEIAKWDWRKQFAEDKTLAAGDPAFGLRSPGAPLDANSVAAVTGATQTSLRLERMFNERVAAWRKRTASAGGEARR